MNRRRFCRFGNGGSGGLSGHFLDMLPIDEIVEPGLEVLRASIAIVDIVAVVPDIAAKDRRSAVHERVLTVRRLHQNELAVLDGEPSPARTELSLTVFDELAADLVEAAVAVDQLLYGTGQFVAAAALLHPLPEVDVIVVL